MTTRVVSSGGMRETAARTCRSSALGRAPGLVFGSRVTDADERRQTVPERRRDLEGDRLVGLAEMRAALAMANLGERRAGVRRQSRPKSRPSRRRTRPQ